MQMTDLTELSVKQMMEVTCRARGKIWQFYGIAGALLSIKKSILHVIAVCTPRCSCFMRDLHQAASDCEDGGLHAPILLRARTKHPVSKLLYRPVSSHP